LSEELTAEDTEKKEELTAEDAEDAEKKEYR